jgi:hypothetical protein
LGAISDCNCVGSLLDGLLRVGPGRTGDLSVDIDRLALTGQEDSCNTHTHTRLRTITTTIGTEV